MIDWLGSSVRGRAFLLVLSLLFADLLLLSASASAKSSSCSASKKAASQPSIVGRVGSTDRAASCPNEIASSNRADDASEDKDNNERRIPKIHLRCAGKSVVKIASSEDDVLAALSPAIEELGFENCTLTERELEAIKQVNRLTMLGFIRCDLSRVKLSTVARQNITDLWIQECQVSESTFVSFSEFSTLRSLYMDVDGAAYDEDLLSEIRRLRKLRDLRLEARFQSREKVPLGAVGEWKNLEEVYLQSFDLSGDSLAGLKGCRRLWHVTFDHCSLPDKSCQYLGDLRSVEEMDLCCDNLTDDGLKRISALPNLSKIDVSCNTITDEGVSTLSKHKKLTDVYLRSSRITDRSLDYLALLPALKSLSLDAGITDGWLSRFSKFRLLTHLSLESNDADCITDTGLVQLKNCQSLKSLDLYGCNQITRSGITHFAGSPVRHFSFYDCKNMTPSTSSDNDTVYMHIGEKGELIKDLEAPG